MPRDTAIITQPPLQPVAAHMTSAEKLAQASALLAEVRDGLDGTKTSCQCCGLTKYGNRTAFQLRTQLDAMVQKLNRFQGSSAITGLPDEGEEDGE